MAKSGTLTVKILGDASGFQKTVGEATGKAETFGKKMSSVGNKLTVGLTLPLIAAGAKATQAAGDLGESINAVNVVFGEAADKIHDFSKIAAGEAGLSMRAFNELVTPVGAALQNVGFEADEAAESSINLAKRAADMASVFNVDVSEALGAIQAGLRGEADPLERFGVGLSAAAVEAEALSSGLVETTVDLVALEAAQVAAEKATIAHAKAIKENGEDSIEARDAAVKLAAAEAKLEEAVAGSTAEIDDQTKMQARLSLLMKQTDRVAGDFKNTIDDAANAQREAAAEAENAAAVLGERLIPVKMKLIGVVSRVVDWFNRLDRSGQNTVLMVAGMAAALGPLAKMISSVITVVRSLSVAMAFLAANPVVLIIAAVAALVAGLVIAYQKSETFRDIVDNAFRVVKIGALTLAKGAVEAFRFLMGVWLATVDTIVTGAAKAFGWVPGLGDKLKGAAAQVSEFRDSANAAMDGIVKKLDVEINANINPLLQATARAQRALNSLGASVRIDGAGGRVSGVRAHGGPVWPGGTFLVGEKGPELFSPSRNGNIVPNNRLGGGGDVYNFTFPNYVGNQDDLINIVRRGLIEAARRNGNAIGGLA